MQVFNLNELLAVANVAKSQVVTWCEECGEEITQEMNSCPGCGDDIVWDNSKTWKRYHGSPTVAKRKLRAIPASNQPGKYLMAKTGLPGFKSKQEATTFNNAIDQVGSIKANKIIDYCWESGSRKRGLVMHVINTLNKAVRKQAQPESEGDNYEF